MLTKRTAARAVKKKRYRENASTKYRHMARNLVAATVYSIARPLLKDHEDIYGVYQRSAGAEMRDPFIPDDQISHYGGDFGKLMGRGRCHLEINSRRGVETAYWMNSEKRRYRPGISQSVDRLNSLKFSLLLTGPQSAAAKLRGVQGVISRLLSWAHLHRYSIRCIRPTGEIP